MNLTSNKEVSLQEEILQTDSLGKLALSCLATFTSHQRFQLMRRSAGAEPPNNIIYRHNSRSERWTRTSSRTGEGLRLKRAKIFSFLAQLSPLKWLRLKKTFEKMKDRLHLVQPLQYLEGMDLGQFNEFHKYSRSKCSRINISYLIEGIDKSNYEYFFLLL